MPTIRAVILARGLGTRMRKADDSAALDAAQSAAADSGVKGMIPIGRPFMDYLISALADAGFTEVCIVIGPDHGIVRDYYERQVVTRRVRIAFAIQRPALIAFERSALTSMGNVPAERAPRFGAMEIDADGYLERIVATPASAIVGEGEVYASLNCWLFTREIFRACRSVGKSARGELELPQAVQLAICEGWMRFEAVRVREGVLDMSSRGDIASVAERLSGIEVTL